MPPVNTITVHTLILPPERRDEEVLRQAKNLLKKALGPVNDALEGRDYIIGDFSAADVMLGHACYMSRRLLGDEFPALDNLNGYIDRIEQRAAFQTGINA